MKTEMELKILDWIQTIHVSWLDKPMVGITTIRKRGYYMDYFCCDNAYYTENAEDRHSNGVSLALEVLCCNMILKPLISRVKPCDVNAVVFLLIRRPADFSISSDHTGAAFAAAAALYFGKNKL